MELVVNDKYRIQALLNQKADPQFETTFRELIFPVQQVWRYWKDPSKETWKWQRDRASLIWEKLRDLFILEKKMLRRDLVSAYEYLHNGSQ